MLISIRAFVLSKKASVMMSVGSSSSFEDSKFQDVRRIGWWFWISIVSFWVSISEMSVAMFLFSGAKIQTFSSMSESSLSLSSAYYVSVLF